MLTQNPFATAAPLLPGGFLQAFLVVMFLAVVLGTIFDMVHKGSARYFFDNLRTSKAKRKRELGGSELVSIAVQTAVVDVMASGEFCNTRRRIAHLLGMYGFVVYVATTAILVFAYDAPATPAPAIVPALWWLGALMILVGGYWFWFFVRVDVAAEGHPALRVMRADLFVLSLVVSVTLAVLWAGTGGGAGWLFWLYMLATAVLFCGVPWSKFAHMFFKPAAAFDKRVARANGTAENLPTQTRDNPEQRKRHSMELLREAPMDMGLGIKRDAPRHY
ncbi:MAG TPA: adenylyl-sulfate reductase [Usitatibacter sp.]|nr:adenylyl-sulfate reductase [Usitatibacter sp.]